ncbi:MAG: preprotein translocase subunit YajC [Planctomycetota bacterium]|nr:MAG: preprotein translocase subunit YajC [Planctomycetota bacterium]
MTGLSLFFAQTTQTSAPPQPGLESMLMPLVVIGLIMYFLMIRPQSKERKKREEMLNAVKKNDRVVTIGGIMGTVLSIKDDEITLKVDESSNTKITFLRSAIQRVISSAPGEGTDSAVTKK